MKNTLSKKIPKEYSFGFIILCLHQTFIYTKRLKQQTDPSFSGNSPFFPSNTYFSIIKLFEIIIDMFGNGNFSFHSHWQSFKRNNNSHCVKSARIRSYSGPHFSAFGPIYSPNTDTFLVLNSCKMCNIWQRIQIKYLKILKYLILYLYLYLILYICC